jgi:protein-S-isoprenylcysteine O-methyltransferase Ste14
MAGRVGAVLGSIGFLFAAPAIVAGLIPYLISGWRFQPPLLGLASTRLVGRVLTALAAGVVLESFGRFALVGRGTPAPVAPPQVLVVSGFYRHVRNPMYVAVVTAIVGQGLVFGSTALLVYAAVVWLLFESFVRFYEEPNLRRRFGEQYRRYCAQVPRWRPRFRPWTGPG